MLRRKFRLTTLLSPEECAARIAAAIDPEPPTYPLPDEARVRLPDPLSPADHRSRTPD